MRKTTNREFHAVRLSLLALLIGGLAIVPVTVVAAQSEDPAEAPAETPSEPCHIATPRRSWSV